MKRTIIAVSLLLVAGMLTGCNKGKDEVLPDGTKMFGDLTHQDGTRTLSRIEFPDGTKQFDVTKLPDGSEKIGRIEFPNGEKAFDAAVLPNGLINKIGRDEFDGQKQFDKTRLPDHTERIGHTEFPDGEKDFDVVLLQDHTAKIGRVEFANGEKRFNVTRLPDGTEKVDLMFRGLHAGQTRDEVEAVLKQQDATLSLHCEKPHPNGSVSCDPDSISFSRDGKLVHFQIYASSHGGEDSESFFSSLRQELAAANHKEGEAEPRGGDALSGLTANMGIRSFTWDTPQRAVCLWNQEEECPAQQITLTEHHQCSSYDGRCMAFVELTDNASLTEGWVKKDKNRTQPKVTVAMTFMGLEGGEPRSQVDAALQRLHYRPLTCKSESGDVELKCTTRSREHQFELLGFVHGRLSSLRFRYPANEHDELYQTFIKSFGEPTDYAGKKGAELLTWNSESTVPCSADEEKQCTATALMFSPPDDGEPRGTVLFIYTPLVNLEIKENAQRMIRAAQRY